MEPVANYFYQIDINAMTTPEKVDEFRKMVDEWFTAQGVPVTYGQSQHLRGINMGPMDMPQGPSVEGGMTDPAPDGDDAHNPGQDPEVLDAPVPSEA